MDYHLTQLLVLILSLQLHKQNKTHLCPPLCQIVCPVLQLMVQLLDLFTRLRQHKLVPCRCRVCRRFLLILVSCHKVSQLLGKTNLMLYQALREQGVLMVLVDKFLQTQTHLRPHGRKSLKQMSGNI
uniref:Uncharacterized protein n=1 Tax=Arundo donax TaxID=35708 RepID=A0A0A9DMF0_ARUDO